jgi:hypothetical protein
MKGLSGLKGLGGLAGDGGSSPPIDPEVNNTAPKANSVSLGSVYPQSWISLGSSKTVWSL